MGQSIKIEYKDTALEKAAKIFIEARGKYTRHELTTYIKAGLINNGYNQKEIKKAIKFLLARH